MVASNCYASSESHKCLALKYYLSCLDLVLNWINYLPIDSESPFIFKPQKSIFEPQRFIPHIYIQ